MNIYISYTHIQTDIDIDLKIFLVLSNVIIIKNKGIISFSQLK